MIDRKHKELSIRRQSELLNINRSTLYIKHQDRNDSYLCNLIVEVYSSYPIYGYRRITAMLQRQGEIVNKKRILRLMKEMNLRAIYPGPNTSKRNLKDMVFPYLLKDRPITRVNMVWQVDITYLRTDGGFMYLVALIDVYSRLVVGVDLSNSLCTDSCIKALEEGITKHGRPDIINSDQGSQFTSIEWVNCLRDNGIKISMTGTGRSNDNANIERLWRAFKYEGSYLYKWNTVAELKKYIPRWIEWYNYGRPHQSLKYMTPYEKYCGIMDKSYDLATIPQLLLQNLKMNFVEVKI